jgi:GNAT superfamily N-acetyltransferase
MEFVELGPQHEEHFRTFSCARSNQVWTESFDYLIQQNLAPSLESGDVNAFGVFADETLLGLLIWTPESNPANWQCVILAVRRGHFGNGIGRKLKEELLRRARAAGIRLVSSLVHCDNHNMIGLNRKLGAVVIPDPDPANLDHCICTIEILPNQ